MSTRIVRHSIPAAILQPDDRVTLADQYANVADLQVARLNHNILLARRTKRMLICQSWHEALTGEASTALRLATATPASRREGDVVFSAPLKISAQTQEITVTIRGANTYSAGAGIANTKLYFCLDGPGQSTELAQAKTIEITGLAGVYARYSVDVPVSRESAQSGYSKLTVYMQGSMSTTDNFAAATVTAVGNGFVEINTPAPVPLANEALYFGNSQIEPRLITAADAGAAGRTLVYVDRPWNVWPTAGVSTVRSRNVQIVRISLLSVYEKAVTDFSAPVDVP